MRATDPLIQSIKNDKQRVILLQIMDDVGQMTFLL